MPVRAVCDCLFPSIVYAFSSTTSSFLPSSMVVSAGFVFGAAFFFVLAHSMARAPRIRTEPQPTATVKALVMALL